jgi:hypothetical protein
MALGGGSGNGSACRREDQSPGAFRGGRGRSLLLRSGSRIRRQAIPPIVFHDRRSSTGQAVFLVEGVNEAAGDLSVVLDAGQ